jgi:uridine kinase
MQGAEQVEIPTYDFVTHQRQEEREVVKTAPIIMFEGIHALQELHFRNLFDLMIFVLTPDDIRLARRIQRDNVERGRDAIGILE